MIGIMYKYYLAILVTLVLVSTGLAAPESLDPIQEINRYFDDSIKIKLDRKKSIEFCPDNTCDLFVAKKGSAKNTLEDFAYIYIYFFSDYYVLNDWRISKESILVTDAILSKPAYRKCNHGDRLQSARCILRKLSTENHIEIFNVRYDEGVRSEVKKNIP